jgi:two-component system CitB family response regulator
MDNDVKVLIGEDDRRIAEIQRQFLDRIDGFEVIGMAHSLQSVCEMTEILGPDLLLLDIHFPDGNGLDFVNQLREGKQQTDVILVTAARDVEMLKTAIYGGVFDYIVKPLVFDRIRESLERYRERVARLRELDTVNQSDIDAIMPRAHPASPEGEPALPKGVDILTLNKVRDFLESAEQSIAASDVGDRLGVSRTTARRYLEYLVSTRELQVDLSYGGVGRPERYYSRIV